MAREIMGKTMYEAPEIADMLGVSPRTVGEYIRNGKLKGSKFGKSWHVAEDELKWFLSGDRYMAELKERFEAKFIKGDGCWEWTAVKDKDGYGKVKIAGRQKMAHRVSYQLYIGAIPDGLFCLHHCDNPSCVNPAHLFLGTDADNMQDCLNKGRGARPFGEKHWGAKLTEEQVKTIRARRIDGVRNTDLAKEYGVAHQTISNVTNHIRWTKI